jgi:thymidine kinase
LFLTEQRGPTMSAVAHEHERAIAALNASRTPAAVFTRAAATVAPAVARPPLLASLHLIVGPMFAGKSTELQRRMRRYVVAKQRTLLITHAADQRYATSGVVTHDRVSATALSMSLLADVPRERWTDVDVIGIDEAQFFDDLVEFVTNALAANKTVVVAALSGTFEQQVFGHVLELVPLADSLEALTAVCSRCGAHAPFTRRRNAADSTTVVIGGAEMYEAVCRAHIH